MYRRINDRCFENKSMKTNKSHVGEIVKVDYVFGTKYYKLLKVCNFGVPTLYIAKHVKECSDHELDEDIRVLRQVSEDRWSPISHPTNDVVNFEDWHELQTVQIDWGLISSFSPSFSHYLLNSRLKAFATIFYCPTKFFRFTDHHRLLGFDSGNILSLILEKKAEIEPDTLIFRGVDKFNACWHYSSLPDIPPAEVQRFSCYPATYLAPYKNECDDPDITKWLFFNHDGECVQYNT